MKVAKGPTISMFALSVGVDNDESSDSCKKRITAWRNVLAARKSLTFTLSTKEILKVCSTCYANLKSTAINSTIQARRSAASLRPCFCQPPHSLSFIGMRIAQPTGRTHCGKTCRSSTHYSSRITTCTCSACSHRTWLTSIWATGVQS